MCLFGFVYTCKQTPKKWCFCFRTDSVTMCCADTLSMVMAPKLLSIRPLILIATIFDVICDPGFIWGSFIEGCDQVKYLLNKRETSPCQICECNHQYVWCVPFTSRVWRVGGWSAIAKLFGWCFFWVTFWAYFGPMLGRFGSNVGSFGEFWGFMEVSGGNQKYPKRKLFVWDSFWGALGGLCRANVGHLGLCCAHVGSFCGPEKLPTKKLFVGSFLRF